MKDTIPHDDAKKLIKIDSDDETDAPKNGAAFNQKIVPANEKEILSGGDAEIGTVRLHDHSLVPGG